MGGATDADELRRGYAGCDFAKGGLHNAIQGVGSKLI